MSAKLKLNEKKRNRKKNPQWLKNEKGSDFSLPFNAGVQERPTSFMMNA